MPEPTGALPLAAPTTAPKLLLPSPEPTATTVPLKPHLEGDLESPTSFHIRLIDDYPVSIQHPAILDIEMIASGATLLSQYVLEKNGARQLVLQRENLTQDSYQGDSPLDWPAGVNEFKRSWTPEGYYLTSGTDGAFVTVQPILDGHITINAKYSEPGSTDPKDVLLIYDGPSEEPFQVVEKAARESIELSAGSEIEVWNSYLSTSKELVNEPALKLTPDDAGKLVLEMRPLPAAGYSIVYRAERDAGYVWSDPLTVETAESITMPDQVVHVYPLDGFQYNLPAAWSKPSWDEGRIFGKDPTGSITLSLSIHPDLGGNGPEELRSLVLQNFGPVSLLYQDQTAAGGWGALRSIYAYDAEDGEHKGLFITFVKEGVGYVLDLDSTGVGESDLQKLAEIILGGWRFRDTNSVESPGRWVFVDTDILNFYRPSEYIHEQLDNGWQRMVSNDGDTFLAIRSESAEQRGFLSALARWQDVTSFKTTEYVSSEVYKYTAGGVEWSRADFEYLDAEGQKVAGMLMGTTNAGSKLFIWAETPNEDFQKTFNNSFRIIINSIVQNTG